MHLVSCRWQFSLKSDLNLMKTYRFKHAKLQPGLWLKNDDTCIFVEDELVVADTWQEAIQLLCDAYGVSGFISCYHSYDVFESVIDACRA